MDQEMREILNKILHGQTAMSENIGLLQKDVSSMKSDISILQKDVGSLQQDVSSMKGDISALQQDVGSMKGDISALQQDVGSMKGDISVLQTQVAKNTLLLESTRKDIQIIAEVQQSHYEQNQRAHQEILTVIDTRSSTIESAVKSISSTLGEIQEDNQSFDTIIGRHARSIETIQRKLAKAL
ncbi:hypothetical protein DesLBE_2257 [Desulfitobacterium sp. LBE]|uniref:hypothetical protein n=1 Tax=Desulfitobacterium sp. LBE TaxID=884086 RepID=UPI00119AF687|nr:hypothetical protein [Desulfitobacterium sp. LBE]TWH57961.1 hypothetical protein DesLBE_2257 [Desulfitobacterium sp. LBE]